MEEKIGQKQAVINAVAEAMGTAFLPNSTVVKDTITADQLHAVREAVLEGIIDGKVTYSKALGDVAALRRYVNGMVDNHFRKAPELNGNTTYAASTEGSPRGRSSQLGALKKLSETFKPGTEQYTAVQNAIAQVETSIEEAKKDVERKKNTKNIDLSVLPPELQELATSV